MPERFAKLSVPVTANECVAPGHQVTTFGDAEMAVGALPGQFFQIRLSGPAAPFLPRPLSIFDWDLDDAGRPVGFKVLYKVVGEGTTCLSVLEPGETVAATGPLGNSFELPEVAARSLLVAGGIGIAPFKAFVVRCIAQGADPTEIELLYGARTKELLVCVEDFEALGVRVHTVTDDGSSGRAGTAVGLLEERLVEGCLPPRIYASGPTPMLLALAALCRRRDIEAQVSLEARMICGIALCNSCAVRVVSQKDPEGWEYKLVCREGPVFNARSLYVEPTQGA